MTGDCTRISSTDATKYPSRSVVATNTRSTDFEASHRPSTGAFRSSIPAKKISMDVDNHSAGRRNQRRHHTRRHSCANQPRYESLLALQRCNIARFVVIYSTPRRETTRNKDKLAFGLQRLRTLGSHRTTFPPTALPRSR